MARWTTLIVCAYCLMDDFQVYKFSGGPGPEWCAGDFLSPEDFCAIDTRNLNSNSRYYRAINIRFPNDYDQTQGYSGNNLMIHGDCC